MSCAPRPNGRRCRIRFTCSNRLTNLILRGDLIRVKLKINTADSNNFHLVQGMFSTASSSAC